MTKKRNGPARSVTVGVGAALFMLLLTGCGGADENGDSAKPAQGAGGQSAAKEAPGIPAPGNADADPGGGTGAGAGLRQGTPTASDRTSARVLPEDRDIVYRGQITVRVRDVAQAAHRAEDLALQADGVVFSQQTSLDPDRDAAGEAQLTLRVPPAQFKPTLDAIGALGRELSRSRSAQDVTTELADTDSRVRSQQRSVDRVRALLAEADTIGEVVQVEAELARREADLESLQAQLARLKDVTDLATIEVTLVARGEEPEPEEDGLGFVSGLRGGWEAFVEIVLVVLTVLGALLPFAVAAGIVGLPTYLMLRTRRRPAPAPPAAPTTST